MTRVVQNYKNMKRRRVLQDEDIQSESDAGEDKYELNRRVRVSRKLDLSASSEEVFFQFLKIF